MEEHKKKSRSEKISISKIEFHKNKSEEDKLNFSNKIRESNLSRHIQPWETGRCTQEQINLVWSKADHLFDLFLLGSGARKLATMYNGTYSNFKGIVEKFKSGWVPKNDQHWIKQFCVG